MILTVVVSYIQSTSNEDTLFFLSLSLEEPGRSNLPIKRRYASYQSPDFPIDNQEGCRYKQKSRAFPSPEGGCRRGNIDPANSEKYRRPTFGSVALCSECDKNLNRARVSIRGAITKELSWFIPGDKPLDLSLAASRRTSLPVYHGKVVPLSRSIKNKLDKLGSTFPARAINDQLIS